MGVYFDRKHHLELNVEVGFCAVSMAALTGTLRRFLHTFLFVNNLIQMEWAVG